MQTVVPFRATDPKTRLAPVLEDDERRDFAHAMLADVVRGLDAAGAKPEVFATEPLDCNASVTVDDRPLDPMINDVLASTREAVAIVTADLALATPDAVDRLFEPDADVVLAPGRGGGTNALVARQPDFRVDYHDGSIRDHRRIARKLTDDVVEIDSYRLATDVDEPDDLAEVLLHGEGEAREWLVDAGFGLAVSDGRVGVARDRT